MKERIEREGKTVLDNAGRELSKIPEPRARTLRTLAKRMFAYCTREEI